eukprot:Pgem_evm2s17145
MNTRDYVLGGFAIAVGFISFLICLLVAVYYYKYNLNRRAMSRYTFTGIVIAAVNSVLSFFGVSLALGMNFVFCEWYVLFLYNLADLCNPAAIMVNVFVGIYRIELLEKGLINAESKYRFKIFAFIIALITFIVTVFNLVGMLPVSAVDEGACGWTLWYVNLHLAGIVGCILLIVQILRLMRSLKLFYPKNSGSGLSGSTAKDDNTIVDSVNGTNTNTLINYASSNNLTNAGKCTNKNAKTAQRRRVRGQRINAIFSLIIYKPVLIIDFIRSFAKVENILLIKIFIYAVCFAIGNCSTCICCYMMIKSDVKNRSSNSGSATSGKSGTIGQSANTTRSQKLKDKTLNNSRITSLQQLTEQDTGGLKGDAYVYDGDGDFGDQDGNFISVVSVHAYTEDIGEESDIGIVDETTIALH